MAEAGVQEKARTIISSGNEVGDDLQRTEEEEEAETMVEEAFKNLEVPSWRKQITVRAIVTSFLLSIIFNFMVCKLNLTTGVIPSFNIAAGLLGFAALKLWTASLHKLGFLKQPFTRQENTVIQTCIVASSGIAFSSGTATYLLGMSSRIAAQADEGNIPINVKQLSIGWMIGFLFVVSFVGLFSILPLRKIMIEKCKLVYPSGTATAYLINGLHTPNGSKLAKKQIAKLFKSACVSFASALFQWFFASADGCGFSNFPTFGLKAYQQRFYFDFSLTYISVGMLCTHVVNVSLLTGAIISWGIMWPLIERKKGHWYDANISGSSLHGIQGYRVFIAVAMILGDGAFHIIYMLGQTIWSLVAQHRSSAANHGNSSSSQSSGDLRESFDEKRRSEFFSKDQIPTSLAILGYIFLAALSIMVVPFIFHQLKWYHILVAYVIAPLLAFCNAYGCGLTDWSLASNYGKVAIMIFSSWVGLEHGGIVAGLAACGVMMSIVSTASDLMQDFKTGYLTLASPRSMFFSQVCGTAMGCLITPFVFWIFYKAYPLGDPGSSYPAPYGLLYRGIALLGVEGRSALPKHCLELAIIFFFAAIVINIIREVLRHFETRYEIYTFIPIPMCMAIPFYLGGYFAISMCIGSLIQIIWQKRNSQNARDFGPAVASGLICGESLWGIPAAILSLAGVGAPICMKFLSASTNSRVDAYLTGH